MAPAGIAIVAAMKISERIEVMDIVENILFLLSHSFKRMVRILRALVSCVVEFAIAEMACVSRNVRRTFHVPSGVPVQRSISERSVSYPSCFSNPLPQRLRSFSFRGCRRFVVGYLLSRLLVM